MPKVSFSTDAMSVSEDGWFVMLDVVLDRVPVYEVSVRVRTVDGEAVGDADFWSEDEILTFPPGIDSLPVVFDIVDDTNYEPDESFSVTLSEPSAATLGAPSEATITILADDWPPFVYLADGGNYTAAYAAFEQNGQIAIPVRLSESSGYEARVGYATSGGTATVGEDYQAVSGTMVFEPGRTEHLIVIPIEADANPDSG